MELLPIGLSLLFFKVSVRMNYVIFYAEIEVTVMLQEHILDVDGTHRPKTKLGLCKMQTLLDAAEKLFTQSGFAAVSISDICKEAHTAVGTFYIYFETKTDIYRYLVEKYKDDIRKQLAASIACCTTRLEMEREGIKCFVRYAVSNPSVYNIIWGSLAVDNQMFTDYYESFARSYARALRTARDELAVKDVDTLAYMLMGITNFLGLRAIFEGMTDEQIDETIDAAIMPILEKGMFR